MRKFSEFINESVNINKALFKLLAPDGTVRSINNSWRDNISKELNWTVISDEDYEKLDPIAAYNREYKRNSTDYIIWMKDNKIVFRSIGLLVNYSGNKRATIKNSYLNTDYAILIKDYTRFDTNTLKDLKRKQNVALKEFNELTSNFNITYTDWFTLVENPKNVNKVNLQLDVFTTISNTIKDFAEMLSKISDCEVCKSNLYKNITEYDSNFETLKSVVDVVKDNFINNTLIRRNWVLDNIASVKGFIDSCC